MELGHSAAVREGDTLTVGAHGGAAQALAAKVSSVREFAGYWEYLISGAIFTEPPHPIWSGAALIDPEGKLVGIGSLFVQDAEEENADTQPGMFVPVDLLKPIFESLIEKGRTEHPRARGSYLHGRNHGTPFDHVRVGTRPRRVLGPNPATCCWRSTGRRSNPWLVCRELWGSGKRACRRSGVAARSEDDRGIGHDGRSCPDHAPPGKPLTRKRTPVRRTHISVDFVNTVTAC